MVDSTTESATKSVGNQQRGSNETGAEGEGSAGIGNGSRIETTNTRTNNRLSSSASSQNPKRIKGEEPRGRPEMNRQESDSEGEDGMTQKIYCKEIAEKIIKTHQVQEEVSERVVEQTVHRIIMVMINAVITRGVITDQAADMTVMVQDATDEGWNVMSEELVKRLSGKCVTWNSQVALVVLKTTYLRLKTEKRGVMVLKGGNLKYEEDRQTITNVMRLVAGLKEITNTTVIGPDLAVDRADMELLHSPIAP